MADSAGGRQRPISTPSSRDGYRDALGKAESKKLGSEHRLATDQNATISGPRATAAIKARTWQGHDYAPPPQEPALSQAVNPPTN